LKHAAPAIVLDTEQVTDADHKRGYRTKNVLLRRHMHYDQNTKPNVMSLDRCDAILIVVDEVAHKIGLRLVWSQEQKIYVSRNGKVVPTGIILEQKVSIGASVVEQLIYEVHGCA
jgi:hypothetical protein